MAEEKINKQYGILKVIMEDQVDDLKDENLQSIAGVLERKTSAIKTLEEEIVELETSTENMRKIINEGRVLKYTATKLNTLNKFLGKLTGRGHDDNATKTVNTVNLPKLEISKYNGDPTKWQSFFDSFQATVGNQQT